jgi:small conductance mechanosensitive channel
LVGLLVDKLIARVATRFGDGKRVAILLLGQISKTAVFAFGAITALGTLGVNVSALVAGLGLTGFALGFALKDALSNMLCGFLILIYHPFRIGDRISVTGLDGSVANIDLRYTTLTEDGRAVLIPNSNLFTNPIIVQRNRERVPGSEPHAL